MKPPNYFKLNYVQTQCAITTSSYGLITNYLLDILRTYGPYKLNTHQLKDYKRVKNL